jgi:hypothetical protein
MRRQNPPDHVLVEFDTEGFTQLLRNPGTARTRIPLPPFNEARISS